MKQASANHQTTGEKISAALSSIYGTLRRAQRHSRIADTPETQLRLVEIYIKVFEFLCFAMSWYRSRWKRFRKSFNKNFDQKDLDPKIKAIKDEWQNLLDEVQLVTNARIEGMSSTLQGTAGDVASIQGTVLSVDEKLDFLIGLLYPLGIKSVRQLNATEQHFTHDRQHGAIQSSTAVVEHQQAAEDALGLDHCYGRAHMAPHAKSPVFNSKWGSLLKVIWRSELSADAGSFGRSCGTFHTPGFDSILERT